MSGPYSQFLDLDNTRDPYAFEDPDIFQDPILNDMSLFGPDEYQQSYNPQSQYQQPYNPPQSQYQSPYTNNLQQSSYQSPYNSNNNNSPYQQPLNNKAYIQPPPPPQQTLTETAEPLSKRLRSRHPKPIPVPARSTTPDGEPPYHLTLFSSHNLPGTVSSLLTAHLQVPLYTTLEERTRRENEIKHLFSANTNTTLPPPSPRVKNLPDLADSSSSSSSATKIYKIRAAPCPPEITSLPPQPDLGKFIKIDDSLGPKDDLRRIQAMDYNNHLAALRLRNLKNRNNVAAMRSRNRRDRAAVLRAEEASFAKAECRYWKAKAIAAGADPKGWEYLPDVAKEAVAADYRIDALDFFQDVGEVAPAAPKKVLKRKR
ncbi:uncharacterized protein CCOS01_04988 [Colletotrichum costaricense]|uniref:BZIP domain-containing protein n=1 Tax=Colletotrichum costaricense TaxID=1209916 RepID=A0AAI9Z3V1_9PEZI|nr:uncharacterized protein CCOS01_04988 [Colletotrichum costaricense]KAK1533005.1 hypothetical protein CCOS01_04988 [Colletotrichum costaricense]